MVMLQGFLDAQRLRGNSVKTITFYKHTLQYFVDYIQGEPITLEICRAYQIDIQARNLSTVSVQSYIRALRAFLSWCFEEGYIDDDISKRLRLPKAERKVIDVLTDDEITAVLEACRASPQCYRDLAIVSLMLDSGLRLNEVVTAQADKLHIMERYLIVSGKGNKQRVVPFGRTTAEALIELPSSGNLFLLDDGRPMTEHALKDLFRRLKKRSGVNKLHPHLLRHTFATKYLINGGNIYTLQAIMGHTSLEMVKRYLHLASSLVRQDYERYSPMDIYSKRGHP